MSDVISTATKATAENKWFFSPKPNPHAQLRLFCFPYAGGGAQVYWDWADHLPKQIEVCLTQLPGRGIRMKEVRYTRMLPLVEAIAEAILPRTDKPFALFGHSMGALIGFELARLLYKERGLIPAHLFVSGARAPQMRATDQRTYDWPDGEFVEDLRRLNGTPPEVLEHEALMELVLPLLRSDFEIVQTYSYVSGQPLKCSITAFGGLQDQDVRSEHLQGWREQTAAAFTLRMFPGDHFFVHTSQASILRMLSQELLNLLHT